jgi:energy-coupling factor transporter ATP-binding protein EcfA2
MSKPVDLTLSRIIINRVGGIEHVDINIEGQPVVVIGGDNEAGKTTILRVIVAVLAAMAPLPGRRGSLDAKMPVAELLRDDELAGDAELHFGGGIVVKRTWTRKPGKQPTSKVTVEGIDTTGGAVTALKRLWSQGAIDLGSVEQLDDRELSEEVRKLLGLDFSEQDRRAAKLLEHRKAVNAETKRLAGHLAKLDPCSDAPDEPVSTEQLLAELKRRREHNAGLRSLQQAVRDTKQTIGIYERDGHALARSIIKLEAELEAARAQKQRNDHQMAEEWERHDAEQAKVDAFDEQPVDDVEEQLRNAGETNRRVQAKKEHERATEQLDREQRAARELTARLDAIKDEKRRQLAAVGADCPVDGLEFDRDGLMLLDGRPYRQNSTARRLRFLVPLMLRACGREAPEGFPRVKVVLCDEAAWDAKNRQLIAELAAAEDGQVIATRVGEEGATFVIEEGRVRED